MESKTSYDFLKKPRANSVCTDESDSEMKYSPAEYSNSGAIVVIEPSRSFSRKPPKVERNKLLLLFNTLPIHGKLLLTMLCMIIVNFLQSSIQFYIRKNTSLNEIDIYSICGFIGIVPHIFVISLGILVEGKFSRWPSLLECLSICLSGLILYGVLPLTYLKFLVHLDSNFTLLLELLMIITVSIGSYVFKMEKLPKFKNPEAIILFSGFPISVILSSIIIFIQIDYDLVNSVSYLNKIIIMIVTLILLITLAYARNYQHTRFLKNQRSMFHEKPLTFAGINGILASPILTTVYLTTTIIRWNSIKHQFFTKHYLILLVYGTIVFGIIINILLIIAFTMTSPMYAHCFFPFRIIFDLIFQYFFFGKKANIEIYILSAFGISSAVLGFFGKYKQLRQPIY